ncbi:MAG TPA: hypothetical protein V6D05_16230 [Stenomitos sp.]
MSANSLNDEAMAQPTPPDRSPQRLLLLGHFGSGKTEVAIQQALAMADGSERPLLLDLDFITPYYRSRDVAPELAALGVEVVAPEGELSRSDLPVVTARAVQALSTHPGRVVADVGGDEGARVIGSLAGRLAPGSYQAWMVINPLRPGTGTPQQVADYAHWLERLARIRFTGVVNNANAGPLTQPHHVRAGLVQVQAAADLLGLPIVFSAARAEIIPQLPDLEIRSLSLKMRPPWELPALVGQ